MAYFSLKMTSEVSLGSIQQLWGHPGVCGDDYDRQDGRTHFN